MTSERRARLIRWMTLTARLWLAHFSRFIDDSSPVAAPEWMRAESDKRVAAMRDERRSLFSSGKTKEEPK